MKQVHILTLLLMVIALGGCASDGPRAPVSERGVEGKKSDAAVEARKTSREEDWRPETYVVQKGDTLYSIAFASSRVSRCLLPVLAKWLKASKSNCW
jgi:lipoprotein NlpD